MRPSPDTIVEMALRNPVRIFVRLGALKRFHALKAKTAALPVPVSWDRRRAERRTSRAAEEHDRRTRDRRGSPPFTWDVADFVVVEEPADHNPD